MQIYDTSLRPTTTLKTSMSQIHDIQFSPNAKILAVSGGEVGESGCVELFQWPSGNLLIKQNCHDDVLYSVAWSHSGKMLCVTSSDHTSTIYVFQNQKLEKLRQLKGYHSRPILSAVFLPDDDHVISTGVDQSLRVFRLSTVDLVRTLDNHTAPVRDLAVRPNTDKLRPMIASASADRTVRLWQPTIGRLVRFARLPVEPLAIDWTPDGSQLVASCVDGHVRVIDPDTVEVVSDLKGVDAWAYSIAISPDGKRAFVGGTKGQIKSVVLDFNP